MGQVSASAGVQHTLVLGCDESAPIGAPDAGAIIEEVPVGAGAAVVALDLTYHWPEMEIDDLAVDDYVNGEKFRRLSLLVDEYSNG